MILKRYLQGLPKDLLKMIMLAKDTASSLKYNSYLVGGFVRDLIMQRNNFDLDIVIEGDGIEFANHFASYIKAPVIRHRQFGTATIITPQKFKIDIATARQETYPYSGSLPCVSVSNIQNDLKRRDFTINALAIRIFPGKFSELIDFFGGYHDIKKKKIRVLHDKSFIDDPTRVLRAIRFEQRFGFRIERKTLNLIKGAKRLGVFKTVSCYRLKDELVHILKEENNLACIERIDELLGWDWFIPGLKLNERKKIFLNSVKKTIDWYNEKFPHKRVLDCWLMYFIVLIADIEKKKLDSFLDKFSLKKGEIKRINSYLACKKNLKKILKNKLKPSQVFKYLQPLSYEVIILLKASSKDPQVSKHIENFFKIYNNTRLHIGGQDIKKLGIPQGYIYQTIFKKLLYAKLDKNIITKDEELNFVKNLFKR